MTRVDRPEHVGYEALRCAVAAVLRADFLSADYRRADFLGPGILLATASATGDDADGRERSVRPPQTTLTAAGDAEGRGTSLRPPGGDADSLRMAALVDLARQGDVDAFGQLYDHYSASVYRFVYYRVSTQALAEDLTSDTFVRALRAVHSFQWQGKDFGAWLMTIARNLIVDHYKSARSRLETSTSEVGEQQETAAGPEDHVVQTLTHELLRAKLAQLPAEQRECLVLRFLNSHSISETAKALGRSEGAIKQLQLRAIRNLARLMPQDLR